LYSSVLRITSCALVATNLVPHSKNPRIGFSNSLPFLTGFQKGEWRSKSSLYAREIDSRMSVSVASSMSRLRTSPARRGRIISRRRSEMPGSTTAVRPKARTAATRYAVNETSRGDILSRCRTRSSLVFVNASRRWERASTWGLANRGAHSTRPRT
jgi:hypothetical protein